MIHLLSGNWEILEITEQLAPAKSILYLIYILKFYNFPFSTFATGRFHRNLFILAENDRLGKRDHPEQRPENKDHHL